MSFWNFGGGREFEFTALAGGDLLNGSDTNLNIGDSFTMAFSASVLITVTDNDGGLSGDSRNNEQGDDRQGQIADISVDGEQLFDDAKIYAEEVYIVRANDGAIYYAVEIEVVGGDGGDLADFYAFIGGAPPGGAELTVIGKTNVSSNWIKYRDLSAGLDWSLDAAGAVTIEAEEMSLTNYRVDDVDAASGGEVIKLKRAEGEASVIFGAENGAYDMTIAYIDENDGEGQIEVLVNGAVVATIVLDQNTDGDGGDDSAISTFTLAGLDLAQGDEIALRGARDGYEFARIDAITFQGNQQPEAVDDEIPVNEGGNLSFDLLENDSDPNGDLLTVVAAAGGGPDVAFNAVTASGRTVQASVSSAGILTFAAAATIFDDLALGQSDSLTFDYRITDGEGNFDDATATVTIIGQNDAPEISGAVSAAASEDDAAFGVNLLAGASDVDNGAVLSVSNLTLVEGDDAGITVNGAVLDIDPSAYGALGDAESEVLRYSYNIVDEHGAAVAQTATVTINGANDAPDIENPIVVDKTEDDANFTVDLLAGATDDEGTGLVIQNLQLVSGDVSGIVVNGSTLEVSPGAYNALPDGLAAEIIYSYDIVDGAGAVTPQTATVNIQGVNDAPTAAGETLVFEEDGDPVGANTVLANESDPDAGDSVFVATAGGFAVGSAFLATSAAGRAGTATFQADGSVAFDPSGFADLGVNDTDTVDIAYTVTDTNGGFAGATVTLEVRGQNAAPTANPLEVSGDEDTEIAGQIVATDPDLSDVLTYTLQSQGANGTVSLNPNGSFTYAATDEHFNGSDGFTYLVSDPHGGSDIGSVTITVQPVNDDPDADDQSVSGEVDTLLSGALTATDVDGDTLTFSLNAGAADGDVQVAANGDFEYTPDPAFFGIDSFTYSVDDGNGGTDAATVTITIAEPNLPPDAIDVGVETDEGTAVSGVLVATDPNAGDILTFSQASAALKGNVSVQSDGDFTYTPFNNSNFNGVDSFRYSVSDGNGGVDTATVTILINPVNDDPVARSLSVSGDEDTLISGQVTATDVDGDTLTFDLDADASFGSVTLDPNGVFDYLPDLDFNGTDSFTYTVDDGNGGVDGATVSITVNPADEAPLALASPSPNTIDGTDGADVLIGTAGDDIMTGGGGGDVFNFSFNGGSATGDGADVITDFAAGVGAGDVIHLAGFGVASLAELAIAPNATDGAVISLADGASIELLGVAPGALAEDDFSFG